jgi:hypothetical protein
MTIFPQQQGFVDEFFKAINPLHGANENVTFSFLAVKRDENFYLVQGVLSFNAAPIRMPFSHFQSDHVRAGTYRLSEILPDARQVVEALLSGQLSIPGEKLLFVGNEKGSFGVRYDLCVPITSSLLIRRRNRVTSRDNVCAAILLSQVVGLAIPVDKSTGGRERCAPTSADSAAAKGTRSRRVHERRSPILHPSVSMVSVDCQGHHDP